MVDDMKLKDKVAIVTGGGTGIGKGISLAYAKEGARLVIANRREEIGARMAEEITASGGEAIFVQTDICNLSDDQRLVDRTLESFGRIDILVNNAGISTLFGPFLEVTEDTYDTILDIDLKGTFFLSQKVARVMAEQEEGVIINITTNIAEIVQDGTSAYAAAKGGLKTLTRNMAFELARYDIRVNAIAPGEIYVENARSFFDHPANKPRFEALPLKRFGYPKDVSGAAVFLASQESSYITGITITIDGGQMLP